MSICPAKRDKSNKLTVIILSSRLEYRKKTIGIKSFYKFNEKSILQIQLEQLNKVFKNYETILCLGYECDKLISKVPNNIRIIENLNFETTSSTEDLRLALNNTTTNNILIIDGGTIPGKNTFGQIDLERSQIFTNPNLHSKIIGVNTINNQVAAFHFSFSNKVSGILHLSNKELEEFKKLCTKENNHMLVHEILNTLVDKINLYNITDKTVEIL